MRGSVILSPDPADRLHLAGEQTNKEAARGGLSFGNGARKGGAVRTAIPLSDTVGAVLIRPAKNLIGAESVQERPIDARGAGRLFDPDWQNGHPMAAAAPQIAP